MKKSGVINAKLAGALAELSHTDRVVVCAAGLPLPPGPEVVDLAFRFGVPSFEVVLSGLLEELVVEGATAAEEVERNPEPTSCLRPICQTSVSSRTRSSSEWSRRRRSSCPHRRGHALLERHPPPRGTFPERFARQQASGVADEGLLRRRELTTGDAYAPARGYRSPPTGTVTCLLRPDT